MTISWQAFQKEALDCLRALVRLDTTNPPGNERIAADYMADALGTHGLDSVIRESAPTRANIVARYPGTDSSQAHCCSPRTPMSFPSSDPDGPASRSAAKSSKVAYGAAARST